MTDDRGKSQKEKRLEKAKVRLQQSFPVQQLVRRSSAVDIAQSIFRQFADDIQLKDLLAKVETLVAGSKDSPPMQTVRDATPSSGSSKQAPATKPAKGARLKKAVPKKTPSKKTKKRAPKRKVKAR